MECALQCNYDRRCLSITYHADYKLCMMKNHLKFDFNNYGNQKRPKCSDLKSYMFKVWEAITGKLPLRSWKARRFERVSLTGNSHSFVPRDSHVSRAPPHHALRGGIPAFLNLHGSFIYRLLYKITFKEAWSIGDLTRKRIFSTILRFKNPNSFMCTKD